MRSETERSAPRATTLVRPALALILAALAGAACEDGTGPTGDTIQIDGTVTQLYTDSVVAGAEVIVDVLSASGTRAWARDTTDATGAYQLEVPVPGGCESGSVNYMIQATAVDHSPFTLGRSASPLVAVCGEATEMPIELYRTVFRTPQPVAGDLTPTELSVGWSHACVITDAGAYCWGWSQFGRLGNASVTEDYAASPVAVTNGGRFTQISVGHSHTCALDGEGAGWCWGDNIHGQVGADTTMLEVDEPFRVRTDLRFVQVQAGRWHSCGLTAAGAVYCWGSDTSIGTGDEPSYYRYTTPQPVLLEGTYVAISSQSYNTCALRDTGALYCWGLSIHGELGAGEDDTDFYTTPLLVLGDHQWKQVDAGQYRACGITTSDVAYCWGRDVSLGDDVVGDTAAPAEVPGGRTYATIHAGGNTCATTAAGAGYCWGGNDVGQLGEFPETWSTTPVQLAPDLTFTTVQAGINYACGITTDQDLVCWGERKFLGSGRPIRPDGAEADSADGEAQP